MASFWQRELENLKRSLVGVAGAVEESLHDAVRSLLERDRPLAQAVIARDRMIDRMEVDVEEECLRLLALRQPVASDLRLIVVVLRIDSDLERIADYAKNIAERALDYATRPEMEIPFDLPRMAEAASDMLKMGLDALVEHDVQLARRVRPQDDVVDTIYREAFQTCTDEIRRDVGRLDSCLDLISAARHLERVADLATNIAEDVIYLIDGRIVRHPHRLTPERVSSDG